MNRPGFQDPLERALAELPRAVASKDFTARVLRALDRRRAQASSRRLGLRWAVAGVAAVVLVATLGLAIHRQRAAERAYRQELETLRSEYRSLAEEVATVRREATVPTRLHLGGDERVDLVLDLMGQPSIEEALGEVLPATLDARSDPALSRPAVRQQ